MIEQTNFLEKLRDAFQMAADATNEYLESIAPKRSNPSTSNKDT